MPEIINCPQCERKLRMPEEMLGRTVKCPSCSTVFTARARGVEIVSPPAEEEGLVEEGVEEASARRRPHLSAEVSRSVWLNGSDFKR